MFEKIAGKITDNIISFNYISQINRNYDMYDLSSFYWIDQWKNDFSYDFLDFFYIIT